tara:strand:- start:43 stop:810 length:768 start_codon:yes stop_codon:yes gene_type:complete
MARNRTTERINISQSVLSRRQNRLKWLKGRLDDAMADRTNMSENYLSIGSQKKYKDLNNRIAKLNFEIMLLEGGTIKDNHIAEWINKNRWKYQNPYTGEVRDFKVGDRFNLDYGGKENLERKDWKGGNHYHKIWNADPTDETNYQTFQLEKIENNIENLQISQTSNQIFQLEGESDEMFNLRKQDFANKVYVKDGRIVKDYTPGSEQMLLSDFNRGTDVDADRTEHNILNKSLIDSLKIKNNEAKRDLSLTNGTQ